MTYEEILKEGRLIKSWHQMDGSWYEDHFRIYKVGDRYFEIKDHYSVSGTGTCSYWGKVTEIEPVEEPTHICLIVGQKNGEAWIQEQESGTPEELMDWAQNYIKNTEGRGGIWRNLTAKLIPIVKEL